ncbi:hypothetical protein MSAN_00468300 [Mycena sanguinolenta]|uniref:Uncharacterized protein n=1 Tax=Mycena sanguinolenta TaxID=230812 RepID=A0A8H6ZGD9_9AGAR|nr:hypothetical protein MSAN_00468300 [Mycena sanguinolenta]
MDGSSGTLILYPSDAQQPTYRASSRTSAHLLSTWKPTRRDAWMMPRRDPGRILGSHPSLLLYTFPLPLYKIISTISPESALSSRATLSPILIFTFPLPILSVLNPNTCHPIYANELCTQVLLNPLRTPARSRPMRAQQLYTSHAPSHSHSGAARLGLC